MARYRACTEIAHWLTQEALHGITRRVDTRGFPESLVVFNPCARAVSGVVEYDYYDNAFALPEKRGREVALLDLELCHERRVFLEGRSIENIPSLHQEAPIEAPLQARYFAGEEALAGSAPGGVEVGKADLAVAAG